MLIKFSYVKHIFDYLELVKDILKKDENIQPLEVIKAQEKEKRKQYYEAFKKKNPSYYKEKRAQEKASNFEKALFNQTKSFAKKKGIIFTIELSDVVIPDFCPLTETEITKYIGEGLVFSNPYIFMKDESLGYIKENIIITCVLANYLRLHATKEQIVAMAKNMLNGYI